MPRSQLKWVHCKRDVWKSIRWAMLWNVHLRWLWLESWSLFAKSRAIFRLTNSYSKLKYLGFFFLLLFEFQTLATSLLDCFLSTLLVWLKLSRILGLYQTNSLWMYFPCLFASEVGYTIWFLPSKKLKWTLLTLLGFLEHVIGSWIRLAISFGTELSKYAGVISQQFLVEIGFLGVKWLENKPTSGHFILKLLDL